MITRNSLTSLTHLVTHTRYQPLVGNAHVTRRDDHARIDRRCRPLVDNADNRRNRRRRYLVVALWAPQDKYIENQR